MNQNSEQQQLVEAEAPSGSSDSLTAFFAVGLVINLVLIAAFVLWARKQWNKSGKPDSPDSEQ